MGESRVILSLASILSFRMLGLFMIYPVFVLYAPQFTFANATLVGIALGIYGLTQAILQLPLSMLSDYIGRKPVITGGLLIFALGSVISAITHNIYIVIIGRAFQGAGAIGSTVMACAADVTSSENRTKAMAILGMTIGVSFALAIVIGPIVNSWLHLSGIFWLTALFALSGLVMTHFFIPISKNKSANKISFLKTIRYLLQQKQLLSLNISIFILHAIFTASFMVIPVFLSRLNVPTSQWQIYLPVLLCAFLLMLPVLIMAEKKNLINQAVLFGILIIAVAEYFLSREATSLVWSLVALALFFVGFTLLEAILPSLISRYAPQDQKGSALGIYSTFQFLGIFAGGVLAGYTRSHYGSGFVLCGCIMLCVAWFIYMFMKPGFTQNAE